jgi:mono/diheme cytochrome c family protein
MTLRSWWLVAGSAVGVLVVVGAAIWLSGSAPRKPDPKNPTLVVRGKAVYAQHCASCHGGNLEGQPNWRHPLPNGRWPAPPHDATGHTWHHPDKVLFQVTKYGMRAIVPERETDMPGFEGVITDADMWAVLSFIESTWSPEIRERQQRMNQNAH